MLSFAGEREGAVTAKEFNNYCTKATFVFRQQIRTSSVNSKGPLKGGLKMAASVVVQFGGRSGKPDFLPLRRQISFSLRPSPSLARTLPSGNLCVARPARPSRAECAKSVKPRPSHVPACREQGDTCDMSHENVSKIRFLSLTQSSSKIVA